MREGLVLPVVDGVIGNRVDVSRTAMDGTRVVHAMCSNGGAKSVHRLRA